MPVGVEKDGDAIASLAQQQFPISNEAFAFLGRHKIQHRAGGAGKKLVSPA
jgi:hypothetical protein